MNELEGFSTFILAYGAPTITYTKNGIGISKPVVQKLNCAAHVKILFDRQGKRMAIQVCGENEAAKVDFCKDGKAEGLRWNSRDLTNTIRNLTGWDVENTSGYKVEGRFIEASEDMGAAIIFDFNDAKAV